MKQLNLALSSVALLACLAALVDALSKTDGDGFMQAGGSDNAVSGVFGGSGIHLAAPANASPADALSTPNPLGEITLGNEDAPITIHEYASLTCSHCALFHNTVLPDLKKEYVETGLVRFVFRPFPLDPYAMTGAMLVQCALPQTRLVFLETLFRRQMQWVRSDDPLNSLRAYAKQVGMSGENFVMCLQSESNLAAVRSMYSAAKDELEVQSTPTFFVNGEKVEGNIGLDKFRKLLDKKLSKLGVEKPEEKESAGL